METEAPPSARRSSGHYRHRAYGIRTLIIVAITAWAALNAALEFIGLDDVLTNLAVGGPLNERSFVPFTIVSSEPVSPTSFVLTVKPRFGRDGAATGATATALRVLFPRARFPRTSHTNGPVVEAAWSYGLWFVEIKQPQLQVARDYTPLPAPSRDGEQVDLDKGYLRFLIRRMDGGEVSTYLGRLRAGDTVELRGPHLGFDVRARLGGADRVVFLAGGTGIAPALQTVRAVLGGSRDPAQEDDDDESSGQRKPSVTIIWANRHRADCPGVEGLPSASGSSGNTGTQASLPAHTIVSLLEQMRARYGGRLRYACAVDEEGSSVNTSDILWATGALDTRETAATDRRRRWGLFGLGLGLGSSTVAAAAGTDIDRSSTPDSRACPHHSATALASSSSKDPFALGHARCGCVDPQGLPVVGGKNLLMVSGPQGFVASFAGATTWANSMEMQGDVGGLIGLSQKALPSFWSRWLVLKL